MEKLTHWKKEANKEYLGSWDLIAGVDKNDKPIYRELNVTIRDVKKQAIPDMEAIKKGENNVTKDELLIWFNELTNPMVIHAKTNFKGLQAATGTPFIERWVGKQVCVYVEQNVRAFGTTTDALRIKPTVKRICSICGNIMDEQLYWKTMNAYGIAICSKECKEKYKGEQE